MSAIIKAVLHLKALSSFHTTPSILASHHCSSTKPSLWTQNVSSMAEIGIIASVLQIADIGLRLSLRLYTFGETVASADNSMKSISKDLSLTSNVLKELAQTLDGGRISRTCSPGAFQAADDIVKECLSIFQEMDQVLVKKSVKTKSPEKDRRIKAAHVLERLRWPFVKGKIELLTSNLERHKTSLALMLGAIAFDNRGNER